MAAPIASIIAQIGIPIIAETIAKSVNKIDHPVAKTASRAVSDLSRLIVYHDTQDEKQIDAGYNGIKRDITGCIFYKLGFSKIV